MTDKSQLAIEKNIFGWDVDNWSRALNYCLPRISESPNQRALEIGAPPDHGGLSLWLGLEGCEVVCSGYDQRRKGLWLEQSSKAKQLHAQYKFTHPIVYEEIDANDIPYENTFDVVVLKSVLGGIVRKGNLEQANRITDQIYKSLKPNGIVVTLENLRSTALHSTLRKQYTAGSDGWRYFRSDELLNIYSRFTVLQFNTLGLTACFGRNPKQKHYLSWLDKHIFEKLVPDSWNYIGALVAKKPSA